MPKLRRGNFIFIAWVGDHSPRHVHVYRDSKLVVKWDLEHGLPMKGKANARVLKHIAEFRKEGKI
jgi:hypothetical protein